MVNNSFFTYNVLELNETLIIVDVNLIEDHPIYQGHFPGLPVTPGVCQVQIVSDVLSACLKKEYQLEESRDIKFLRLIDPAVNKKFRLELILKPIEERLSVSALLSDGEDKFLKMRSIFGLK